MKKLDLFVLRTILVPFITTLLVGNFVLLMAFIFRKMDEIIGKGLGLGVYAKVFAYASASFVPQTVPLAVLISCVMAMGNLGEHNELVSFKSSGVSLLRIMRPLVFASIIMGGITFYFSNNIVPYSTLKLSTLMWDIGKKKPSLLLKEGAFLEDFNQLVIKIEDKGENDMLYDVIIYDHRKIGKTTVIRADSAYMQNNNDSSRFLIMKLMDGNLYDDKDFKSQYTRFAFKNMDLSIDMSGFEMTQTDEELFKNNPKLKHVGQLSRDMDTLYIEADDLRAKLNEDLSTSFKFYKYKKDTVNIGEISDSLRANFGFDELTLRNQIATVSAAKSAVRSIRTGLASSKAEFKQNSDKLLAHKIAWYNKFALAFSCIVLFFIGAPMGALVRKGGFGMPVVVSIVLYVVYYVINIVGVQFAKKGVVSPMLGMWMSTIILFPFAIYLTRKAVQDSRILNFESISSSVSSLITKFFPKKEKA